MVKVDYYNFELTPRVYYDSEPSEATLKLRQELKIDESGYAEHYKWRGLAKLGPVYSYQDPFFKFRHPEYKEFIGTRFLIYLTSAAAVCGAHYYHSSKTSRPFMSRLHRPVLASIAFGYACDLVFKWTLKRGAYKDAIFVDYVDKHPERFEPIKRYKWRDTMFTWVPARV